MNIKNFLNTFITPGPILNELLKTSKETFDDDLLRCKDIDGLYSLFVCIMDLIKYISTLGYVDQLFFLALFSIVIIYGIIYVLSLKAMYKLVPENKVFHTLNFIMIPNYGCLLLLYYGIYKGYHIGRKHIS